MRKLISDIRKSLGIPDIRKSFSDIKNYFFDRKSFSEIHFLISENVHDFLYQKFVYFLISEIIFWYQKFIFWYQKFRFSYQKIEFLISKNNFLIIMGRMGICFTSVATSWWGEACCLLLCFPTGTSYCVALSAVLNFDYLGECSHWGNRGRVA